MTKPDKRKAKLSTCPECELTLISIDGGDWQHITVIECEPEGVTA